MSTNPHDVARALPDYEIAGVEIGHGEFGIVWRGRHRQLQRDVAVKQLAGPAVATDEYRSRFRREARILAQMDHTHVVRVYDYREQDDLRLLIMELLSGGTFAQRRTAGMTMETAIASTIAAASGLHYVHEHGILHRDVKPENLMFDARDTIKVTDFGIARGDLTDSTAVNLTHAGEFFGTPAYVSPEQAGHALGQTGWPPIDATTDQYSLAAVLYEALTGQLTHDTSGGALALCSRRMHEPARPLRELAPHIHPDIQTVVMRALARYPTDRYPTTGHFATELATAAANALGPNWLTHSQIQPRDTTTIETALGSAVPPSSAMHATPTNVVAPLPARLQPSENSVFAGRSAEQARWDDTWKRVVTGERRVWVVGGEAGIGKTTLIGHLASRALDDGAWIAYGRCDEDIGVPYQPWIEALSSLVSLAPQHLIAAHVAARGGSLARLVPELRERAATSALVASDAEAERYALFGAVTDLLMRVSLLQPVVLVLDDLHWADKPTLQLLRHVVGLAEPMHLLVVGTYRPDDLGAGHPLTDAFGPLRRERGVEFIDLGGLGDTELLEMMEAVAGHAMNDKGLALRDAIGSETDGNPFFATEILRHLIETGAIAEQDGEWRAITEIAAHGLPVSIRQVVGERVSRLGADAQRLLRTAAVIGRDFDLRLLAEVADVDEDTALDVLDAAVAAALVRDVGTDRYSFAHALVEHTLYEEVTPSRRGRIHRRIAEGIENALRPRRRARASARISLGSGARPRRRRQGDRIRTTRRRPSTRATRPGRSRTLVRKGAPTPRGTQRRRKSAGRTAHWSRRCPAPGTRSRTPRHAARGRRPRRPPRRHVTARAGCARQQPRLGEHRRYRRSGARRRSRARALEAVGAQDTRERTRLLATLVAELTFDPDLARRRAVAGEAVAIARRLDDPQAVVAALIGQLTLPDRPGTAHLQWADEALELATQLDDPVSIAIASGSAVTSAVSFADRDRLERYIAMGATAATRVGQPELLFRAMGARALEALVDGKLDHAEAIANELLPIVDIATALLWYSSIIVTVRIHQGRAAEIRPLLEGVASSSDSVTASELGRVALLLADTIARDLDSARAGFEEEAHRGFPAIDDQLWLTKVCINAHVCSRLGNRDNAQVLLDILEPNTKLLPASPSILLFSAAACAGMLAALLDRPDDADGYFTQAIAITTAFGAPYPLANAQLEWARALMLRARAAGRPGESTSRQRRRYGSRPRLRRG